MEILLTILFYQEPESLGCLLELTWNAQKSLTLNGSDRKYLEDGDEVIFTACCKVLNLHLSYPSVLHVLFTVCHLI